MKIKQSTMITMASLDFCSVACRFIVLCGVPPYFITMIMSHEQGATSAVQYTGSVQYNTVRYCSNMSTEYLLELSNTPRTR